MIIGGLDLHVCLAWHHRQRSLMPCCACHNVAGPGAQAVKLNRQRLRDRNLVPTQAQAQDLRDDSRHYDSPSERPGRGQTPEPVQSLQWPSGESHHHESHGIQSMTYALNADTIPMSKKLVHEMRRVRSSNVLQWEVLKNTNKGSPSLACDAEMAERKCIMLIRPVYLSLSIVMYRARGPPHIHRFGGRRFHKPASIQR